MTQDHTHKILKNIEALIVEGKYLHAKKYLIEFIQKYPKNPEGHYLLGDVYCKLGEFSLAVEQEEIANILLPQNEQIVHLLGWAYFMNGELEIGRKYMEAVLEINPEHASVLSDLAVLEMRAANEKALEYAEKAIRITPQDPLVQEVYLITKRFLQALQEQKKPSN